MAAPVAPLVLAASALGFGLWWFWPAQKTGAKALGDGGGGDVKKPTAEQTAAAKTRGAADGCARGTADATAGKSPAQATADLAPGGKDNAAWVAAANASGDADAYFAAYSLAHKTCFDAVPRARTLTTYKILPGEDPVRVAAKFKTTIEALMDANPDLEWGDTKQPVVGFSNAVHGSLVPGTSEGQIDPDGKLNVTPIFSPTGGIVEASGIKGWPVYDSNVRVKGAPNNSVYFPYGKAGQPYPAGGPNPMGGRVYHSDAWHWVVPWKSGQVINVPDAAVAAGSGALVARPDAATGATYATGPRIGNTAIVGARRAPVEVDQMHAGMARHFAPRGSSRHGWPAPPDEVDDGTSTLYRSY